MKRMSELHAKIEGDYSVDSGMDWTAQVKMTDGRVWTLNTRNYDAALQFLRDHLARLYERHKVDR